MHFLMLATVQRFMTAQERGEAAGAGLIRLVVTVLLLAAGVRFIISKLSGSKTVEIEDYEDPSATSPNNDPSREGPPRF